MSESELIVILDFGSQFTQLIARRFRELEVYCEIHKPDAKLTTFAGRNIRGLVLSGGPACVNEPGAPDFSNEWLSLGCPILGVCYGMQLLAKKLGGVVSGSNTREFGFSGVDVVKVADLLTGFDASERIVTWMSHGDHVTKMPSGFEDLGRSESGVLAIMADTKRKIYGVQFHPEVHHTPRGTEILRNFLFSICGVKANWTPGHFISESVHNIKATVAPEAKVVCGLSGGVDSTVAAALVSRALGDRLICLFVDTGLLRQHEGDQVMAALSASELGLKVVRVNAEARFLAELRGVSDPELKRKIIGRTFVEVFDEESNKLGNVTHLVQGTLYPDVIESSSVSGPSVTIKTHHNVGGLPERMKLKLIEPLRELFKDEVRRVGRELGLPAEFVGRHPFPGPGLAIRILGEVNKERADILRQADAIYIEEIRAHGLYDQIWQAFAVLLPVKAVGVMGDGRTYENVLALRAVTSEDGMTADWFDFPRDFLRRVSNRIINEVKGVNRVVYDISSKPPATIEWE